MLKYDFLGREGIEKSYAKQEMKCYIRTEYDFFRAGMYRKVMC